LTGRLADPRGFLRALFDAAVAAAQPERCLPGRLPPPPEGRTVVVGCGKAAAAMARAVEAHWQGPLAGLVVTRYGHKLPTEKIDVVEASHPVPDAAGEAAARRMLALVAGLTPQDLVLCLISGGGSALLSLPAPGLTLADKQAMVRALLRSGADINEMNCVRKHLSAIKGGRLALACGETPLVTLAISDVPGDDPSVIASGPTVPDPTSFADARAVLARYNLVPSPAVAHRLEAGPEAETPKPGDPRLARARYALVATPQQSLEAAAALARASGVTPVILGDAIEGEAREVARAFAGIAFQVRNHGQPAAQPALLLSGGETTVTVRGQGRGGPNAEFLLGLALALGGAEGIYALAADTDGIDGTEDNAGALIDPATLARARQAGLDPRRHLADNDAYGFFEHLSDLLVTGPTQTNVNDFRAILIDGAPAPR
jgi:glycerate 2-kinase